MPRSGLKVVPAFCLWRIAEVIAPVAKHTAQKPVFRESLRSCDDHSRFPSDRPHRERTQATVIERSPLLLHFLEAVILGGLLTKLIPEGKPLRRAGRLVVDTHAVLVPRGVGAPRLHSRRHQLANLVDREPDRALRHELFRQGFVSIDGNRALTTLDRRPPVALNELFECVAERLNALIRHQGELGRGDVSRLP